MTVPPIPPPKPPVVSSKPNFGMQAARASWMAPIVSIALNVYSNSAQTESSREAKLTIGLASFAIYIFGLVFGIIALTKIGRYGRKGILLPAIIGVAINGALVLVFTIVIIIAFDQAK